MKGDIRCIEGRSFRHDPQHDDPELETDIGQCPECEGKGCEHDCDSCGKATANAEDDYGEFVCDDCEQNKAEAAYERSCSDFYGGEGPKTLREQQIEAWRLK